MSSSKSLKSAALVSVTALATTFIIQACGGGAIAQSANEVDPVVGLWEGSVTGKDCATGAARFTFRIQNTMNQGGTFAGQGSTASPGGGIGLGSWKRESANTYTVLMTFFQFNDDLSPAGTVRAKKTLTLSADGNSYTSTIARQVLDSSGAVVGQSCATEDAKRLSW
jgi:hypothetical protein